MDTTLQFVAGTVRMDEMERMKRMLYRITMGKVKSTAAASSRCV